MTKLILRLLISGVIVAGIVVAVVLIFFQPAKLEDAYNNIHAGIDTNGEISQLVNHLDNDSIEDKIIHSFGKELVLFKGEFNTLKDNYSKLQNIKDKESKLSDNLVKSVKEYVAQVTEVNKALKSIEDSANVSTVNPEVLEQMINNSKSSFVKQTKLLCEVNSLLIDVLIDTYYNNVYDLTIALDETSTILANQYYTLTDEQAKTIVLNKYETIIGITNTEMEVMLDSSDDQPTDAGDYSNSTTYFVYNLQKVDLNKLLTTTDYIQTLDDDTKVVATNINAYINNIESFIAQVRQRIQDSISQ